MLLEKVLGVAGEVPITCIAAVNLSEEHAEWAALLEVEMARTAVITVTAFLRILFI